MSTYTLTVIDIRRVQQYLFNANELKQNLGASYIVEQATRQWIFRNLPPRHNWLNPEKDQFDPDKKIEDGSLDAEVIFAGGANAVILFANQDLAREFAKCYSGHVMAHAPGLDIAIGHTTVDWSQALGMKTAWQEVQTQVMPRCKEGRGVSQPLMGLGVTAECAYTGRPAVFELREDGRSILVSAEALEKHRQAPNANARLKGSLKVEPFEYPSDFDELGGEFGRSRYLAVIHADGNGMSTRIKDYIEQAQDNRETVHRMRSISVAINRAGMSALQIVRDWICSAPDMDDEGHWQIKDTLTPGDGASIHLKDLVILPMRPLVYGGDDVTLVCDGRLGLPVAEKLLQAFAAQMLLDDKGQPIDGAPIYACAGVALVHTHYPFARAYNLAEDLCKAAKKMARTLDPDRSRAAVLNWCIADAGRTLDNWGDIQKQRYQISTPGDKSSPAGTPDTKDDQGKLLTLRPLIVIKAKGLEAHEMDWRTWNILLEQLRAFRGEGWIERRNKVKELLLALRSKPQAVQDFVRLHGRLPAVPGLPDQRVEETGWYGNHCVYFDALEINDLFIYPKE